MNCLEVPVTARPQTFTLTISSTVYTIKQYWLKPAQCWVLDFGDQSGAPLLCGIPLVPGINLLRQYQYIIPGMLFVVTDDAIPDTIPDFTHLGITGKVYYSSTVV
jgi:hypothetical protein